MEVIYAMPEECDHSILVGNIVQFPEASKRYSEHGASLGNEKAKNSTDPVQEAFAYEDPTLTDFQALEPTSGRKAWMLKHGKRIKKALKPDKRGYVGS